LESGHTPSRGKDEYWNGPIPWIGIRDATGNHGRVIQNTRESITEAGVANSSARVLPAGTVCLSRTASVGFVVSMGRPMATSQDFINWVCGPDLNPRYLHYVLMCEQESIRRFAHGSVHQTLYYPEAKALHICVPSRTSQDAIVEVLGSLDDKIENDQAVAQMAVELALIQGDGFLAEAFGPMVTLASVADVCKGVSYRREDLVDNGKRLVSLKCVGRDGTFQPQGLKPYRGQNHQDQIVKHGDVLVAQTDLTQRAEVIGRPVRVEYFGDARQLVASLDLLVVRPRESFTREVLFSLLSRQDFRDHAISYCNGTTVLHMGARCLPEYRFRVPTDEAITSATSVMRPLFERADAAKKEGMIAGELRDTLMPRLLSGKLRVRDAAATVREAV
jgi:type I restriction enzyme, S subunit